MYGAKKDIALCYVAGDLKPCKDCYRNPDNRYASEPNQSFIMGIITHDKKSCQYVCNMFLEFPEDAEFEILVDLEE